MYDGRPEVRAPIRYRRIRRAVDRDEEGDPRQRADGRHGEKRGRLAGRIARAAPGRAAPARRCPRPAAQSACAATAAAPAPRRAEPGPRRRRRRSARSSRERISAHTPVSTMSAGGAVRVDRERVQKQGRRQHDRRPAEPGRVRTSGDRRANSPGQRRGAAPTPAAGTRRPPRYPPISECRRHQRGDARARESNRCAPSRPRRR